MSMTEQLHALPFYNYFLAISAIPRGTGDEGRIGEYLLQFARDRGLVGVRDAQGNVVIRKPGSPGREEEAPLILQSHMDMVCEKEPGSPHDFSRDPIQVVEDGGYLCAQGTTLGADNGIGMAYTLAVLADDALTHPPLEAVITTGEEVGMEGMAALDAAALTGTRMLNIDAEEEGVFFASCAGGERLHVELPLQWEPVPPGLTAHAVEVSGLRGGHSGLDIDKRRANAAVLLARALHRLGKAVPYRLQALCGGQKTNSIPRQATAVIWLPQEREAETCALLEGAATDFAREYAGCDAQIAVYLKAAVPDQGRVMSPAAHCRALDAVLLMPCGPLGFSPHLEGIVDSSCNIGVVETDGERLRVVAMARANVNSRLEETAARCECLADALGAEFSARNRYAAWEYRADSPLRSACVQVYERMRGQKGRVESIHAGLECALMADKRPDMDMIAIGPNLFDAHTPSERVESASLVRVWEFLCKLLEVI